MKNNSRRFSTIIGVGMYLILQTNAALAVNQFSTLSAEWEQWAYSRPTTDNPMQDTTGEKCAIGQRGSLWFLAGVFGGNKAIRNCSIPEGKSLFFPIFNAINFNGPNVCGQDGKNIPASILRSQIAGFFTGVKVSASIDGKTITPLHRSRSVVFEIALPENNVFDKGCAPKNVPRRIYSPTVDEGYYALLKPLKVGKHILRFSAKTTKEVKQDVIYNLTVVPVLKK
jgi:hypothetical protein